MMAASYSTDAGLELGRDCFSFLQQPICLMCLEELGFFWPTKATNTPPVSHQIRFKAALNGFDWTQHHNSNRTGSMLTLDNGLNI